MSETQKIVSNVLLSILAKTQPYQKGPMIWLVSLSVKSFLKETLEVNISLLSLYFLLRLTKTNLVIKLLVQNRQGLFFCQNKMEIL